jgi:hypothetical protein
VWLGHHFALDIRLRTGSSSLNSVHPLLAQHTKFKDLTSIFFQSNCVVSLACEIDFRSFFPPLYRFCVITQLLAAFCSSKKIRLSHETSRTLYHSILFSVHPTVPSSHFKMKSCIAALGMFAAAASAYSHPRQFNFARSNSTITDPAGQTTLTVIATQTSTVISCAPTVTNCPADESDVATMPEADKTTFVVTNTVILTETICPVSDAPQISASVIEDASSGLITGTTITAPLTTDFASSTAKPDEPEETGMVTSTEETTESKTMTITMGTGTDASTIETVIHTTITNIVTVPCSKCQAAATSSDESPEGPEPTTTTTKTKTRTRTLTVDVPEATETIIGTPGESDGNDSDSGNGGDTPGNGSDDETCDCACAPTVTVTAPASTVYVTIGGGNSPSQTAADDLPEATNIVTNPQVPDDNDEEDGEDCDIDEDDCVEEGDDGEDDDECDAEVTVTATATATVPYPTGNGTSPTYPTGGSRQFRF